MENPQNNYDKIIRRLKESAFSQARLDAWGGLLLSFSACLIIFLGSMVTDQAIVLSQVTRRIVSLMAVACFLAVLGIYTIRKLLERPNLVAAAERVEAHFPQLKARLISTIQLWDRRKDSREGYSADLIEATGQDAADILDQLDLNPILDRTFLIRSYRILACTIMAGLAYSLLFPASFYYSQLRLTHPHSSYGSYVSVRPGSMRLVRGLNLEVDALIWGRRPLRAHLLTQEKGAEPARVRLERRNAGRFAGILSGVNESFSYRVVARGVRSPDFQISVLDRPAVVGLKMKYMYPAYTRMPPVVLDEGVGDVSGLVGTKVILSGRSSVPLSYAAMVMDDSTEVLGSLTEENSFQISSDIKRDGSYHILIRDPDGNENEDPIHYRISAIADEYPTVSIVEPGRDMNLPGDMILRLLISAADDFGLTRFRIVSKKGEEKTRLGITNLRGTRSEAEVAFDWDLSDAGLLPGDVVSYHVEVFDNDTYSGPKKSSSETFRVRFPTLEEIYTEVSEEQDLAAREIESIMPEQRQLKEKLEELRKELAEQRSLSWEEKQSVEEVMERQEKLAEKVEEVSKALDDVLERMESSLVIDQEIFSKMQRISELLSEVKTEEMRKVMENLREAMKELNPEDIKKAMSDLLMNQEELNRRLERTLNILERLKQEQEMKRLAEKASEIEKQHKALSEETEKGGDTEKLAREEDELRKEVEELKKDMERLAEELRQSDAEVSEALQELSQNLATEDVPGQMQQASQMLSGGKRTSAAATQKKIQKQLSSLSEGLKNAQSQMMASRAEEIDEAMKAAQNDLLDLSNAQEELNEIVSALESSTQSSPGATANSQQALKEGVKKVAEKLAEAAQKSFFLTGALGKELGAAIRNMENSEKALESGDMRSAKESGHDAVTAMNNAVKKLMESRKSLSSCSSPGGLSQALDKLSCLCSQQMGVNQGVQSLFALSQEGGKLSLQARTQIARLAAEQRMISEQLSEIARGLTEAEQLLGDLGALSQETEEAAKSLERTDVSRKLVERQERILSRLLDAQRSLRKRDYSPRRKAEVGQDMPWVKGPGALSPDLGGKEKMAQKDLLKALKEAYPKEYEKLIRAYFKSLAK